MRSNHSSGKRLTGRGSMIRCLVVSFRRIHWGSLLVPRICIATLARMLRNTDPSGTDCYGWPCVWNCDSGRWHQFGRSDHVPTNVAISLREMSLARCTLHSQDQLSFSYGVDEVVLRIAMEFPQQWACCKDTSRRSETATLKISGANRGR